MLPCHLHVLRLLLLTAKSRCRVCAGLTRHAYTVGPILLAATGPWNDTLDCLHIPRVDGSKPEECKMQTILLRPFRLRCFRLEVQTMVVESQSESGLSLSERALVGRRAC